MASKDETRELQNQAQEFTGEELADDTIVVSRLSWKKRITGIIQKILWLIKNLVINTRDLVSKCLRQRKTSG